jgi:membrane fusion protein, multidrug efflux system
MSDASSHSNANRRRGFLILGVLILIGALAYGAYWFLDARFYETTDDAYVSGNIVAVTSRENGTIQALHVDNTQTVKRGQLLMEMDPSVVNVNVASAEANLARTIRSVKGEFSHAASSGAQVAQAQVAVSLARADYQRRQQASGDGAVSQEELNHARDSVRGAEAALAAAEGGHDQSLSQITGTDVANNPDVLAAEATLRNTVIAQGHYRIVAPVDGVVAQRTVQVGQQVAAGTPLLAVVPLATVWVDANFKEVQLQNMRVGQPVTITADIYGGKVTYHGKVEGMGAGSGSAFALLPPQNASGNWIKIVQRVPVRILLDAPELKAHPLRIGLSAHVRVDLRDSAPQVSAAAVRNTPQPVQASAGDDPAVEALIERIIADNSGAAAVAAR